MGLLLSRKKDSRFVVVRKERIAKEKRINVPSFFIFFHLYNLIYGCLVVLLACGYSLVTVA